MSQETIYMAIVTYQMADVCGFNQKRSSEVVKSVKFEVYLAISQ